MQKKTKTEFKRRLGGYQLLYSMECETLSDIAFVGKERCSPGRGEVKRKSEMSIQEMDIREIIRKAEVSASGVYISEEGSLHVAAFLINESACNYEVANKLKGRISRNRELYEKKYDIESMSLHCSVNHALMWRRTPDKEETGGVAQVAANVCGNDNLQFLLITVMKQGKEYAKVFLARGSFIPTFREYIK